MPKHHHHAGAIAFAPLLLLALASAAGPFGLKAAEARFETRAQVVEKELMVLQKDFRDAERALNLLEHGEDQTTFTSAAAQHLSTSFDSVFERYANAVQIAKALQERIVLLAKKVRIHGNKAIYIDLSSQQANLIENGKLIRQYPVSSGAPETPTPLGRFQIHTKQTLRISQTGDLPYRMPYYMAFKQSGSHGLHALPYLGDKATNSDFWYEALDHIGIPVSHGCIRFLPEDAAALYEWVEIGTPVYINT